MKSSPQRHGAVLVATLVCLLVVMSLTATMLTGALRHRLQTRQLGRAAQAELIIAAARDRALARFTADATYHGETWSAAIAADQTAAAVIDFTENGPDAWTVEIVVTYPTSGSRSVQRSDRFTVFKSVATPPTRAVPTEQALPETNKESPDEAS